MTLGQLSITSSFLIFFLFCCSTACLQMRLIWLSMELLPWPCRLSCGSASSQTALTVTQLVLRGTADLLLHSQD